MEFEALPSAVEAERGMIGNIILDNLLMEQAKRDCPVEWIYLPTHRTIFKSMLAIHERREDINTITLAHELERDNALSSVGGLVFLSNLTDSLPHVSTLKHFIRLIRETARRRWAMKFAAMLEQQAASGEVSADDLFSAAVMKLDQARGIGRDKRGPVTLEQIGDDQIMRYEQFLKGVSDALPTGFREIDNHLLGGGLVPSALYVLAAPTSMGKTTLGLDIAANVGGRGHRVYIVSREMSRESLFDRLVAFEAGVERWKLRPGIWEKDFKSATAAVVRLSTKPIILDDASSTVSEVRGYFRESENRGDRIELLVVDYLQLLEAEGRRRETRNQEVGSLSRSLKGLAMEFQIPIIAISQLKRIGGREPELDDLRDSGEIEQDADTVMFLFGDRPEEKCQFYERTLKCSKQREGPLFREQLPFNGGLVSYRKAEEKEAQQLYEQSN